MYGTPANPHDNEELVGKALKPFRNKIVLATKFGIHFDTSTTSVNRLLLPDSGPEEVAAGVMLELIREGKITHWGILDATEDAIRKAHAVCPITVIENRYSMMYRDYESLFPIPEELQISFVPFSPLANGFLSDRYNKETKFSTQDDYRAVMPQYTEQAFEVNQELFD